MCVATNSTTGHAAAAATNARRKATSLTRGMDHSNGTLCPMIAEPTTPRRQELFAVACISASLLMTELALTRIFSVVMYYHFAFLAISIALFGLSASGVFAFTFRKTL